MAELDLGRVVGHKGETGAPGAAGVGIQSVTQTTTSSADGGSNVMTVTLSNGQKSTFTVKNGSKGSQGDPGPAGNDGKTPVAGVDYYTKADKAEFTAYLADELAKRGQLRPEFANSIEECTDQNKLYVLPDGYIYAYMYAVGNRPNFNNLADQSSADWLKDKRINSSHNLVDAAGVDMTNYIPVTDMSVLHIKGIDVLSDLAAYQNYGRLYFYAPDKTYIKYIQPSALETVLASITTADYDESVQIFDWPSVKALSTSGLRDKEVAYIRFGGIPTESEIIITDNQPITYSTGGYEWRSTGHAFIPADYEDRIIDLETTAEQQEQRLTNMENAQTKQEVSDLPEYWTGAVESAVSKVKALQDEGGKDVVSFVWLSDLHYNPGDAYIEHVGHLCKTMMGRCDIPFTLLTGDTMSQGSLDSETKLLSYLDGARELLAPIGNDRLLQLRGNHDDVWGSYTANGTTAYYVNKVAPGKIWNRIGRKQSLDVRHTFGGDGTYFYVNIPAQKVRFVCLNTHFYDGDGYSNGTAKNMSFGFGVEQLDWLEHTALDVEAGWKVILASHVPITDAHMSDNGLADRATFKAIVTAAESKILAAFCGHIHRDAIYTGHYAFPVMTITPAANSTYDSAEAARTAGTTTETALDVVCINRETGAIGTVRLGVGSDRSYVQ